MTRFYKIYPTEIMEDVSVFRHLDSEGKLVLRTSYQNLTCPLCGKINEQEALTRGLPHDIAIKTNLDVVESFDHMMIISARFRAILEQTCREEVEFHAFPNTDSFYLLMPSVFVQPTEGDSAFTVVSTCKRCGRHREVVWGPSVPALETKQIMAFQLESRLGLMPSWVASQSLVSILKAQKPKLKGLIFDSLC